MDCSQRQTIFVKIGRIGFKVTEYAVLSGSTGEDILRIANYVLNSSEMVSINGIDQSNSWIKETILDKSLILIKPRQLIKVRVARINEPLKDLEISKDISIKEALIKATRMPFDNEEVWLHHEGNSKGILINLDQTVHTGDIYIIEPKKNLRNKIYSVVSRIYEDEISDRDEATDILCDMLRIDYHLE